MKYCYTCKRYRPDASTFCTQCGSSFGAKYCRKLHRNSTDSEYCSMCGSSELSTPHREPRFPKALLIASTLLALLVTGLALMFVVASLIAYGAIPLDKMLTAAIMAAALFGLMTR